MIIATQYAICSTQVLDVRVSTCLPKVQRNGSGLKLCLEWTVQEIFGLGRVYLYMIAYYSTVMKHGTIYKVPMVPGCCQYFIH